MARLVTAPLSRHNRLPCKRVGVYDLRYRSNDPMKIITDSRCTAYVVPGHPEQPARVSRTVARLKDQTGLEISWLEPLPVTEETLERAHSKQHIAHVRAATADFDGDTPAHAGI